MHQGVSLLSGHYVAYVRVPRVKDSRCLGENGETCLLRPASPLIADLPDADAFVPSYSHSQTPEKADPADSCTPCVLNGTNCNGIGDESDSHRDKGTSISVTEESCLSGLVRQDSENVNDLSEPKWYECDDDTVSELTQTQLQRILAGEGTGSMTPYLLFYVCTEKMA